MNTSLINQILSTNFLTARYYKGCYPSDLLPKPNSEIGSYVVNMDPSHLPGSHWIAIFLIRGHCYYFDSLGGEPKNVDICKWIDKNACRLHYNQKGHQKVWNKTCGAFACCFIHAMSRGISFRKIVDYFNRIANDDEFVCAYMKRHFHLQSFELPGLLGTEEDDSVRNLYKLDEKDSPSYSFQSIIR